MKVGSAPKSGKPVSPIRNCPLYAEKYPEGLGIEVDHEVLITTMFFASIKPTDSFVG
jgi:hypothetical protein